MRTPRTYLAPAALSLALCCSALGCGGDDATAADGVASLGGEAAGADDGAGGGGEGGRAGVDPAFQDAMVEFAECMREHGVDMPDPEFEDGGMVVMGGGPGGAPPDEADREEMEAAQAACQPILDEVQSQMPRPDPEQVEEMREDALEFAECMREHGIDMPDPQFSDDGAVSIEIGGPTGDGVRPAFDPADEELQAAQEACAPEGGPAFGGGAGSSESPAEEG